MFIQLLIVTAILIIQLSSQSVTVPLSDFGGVRCELKSESNEVHIDVYILSTLRNSLHISFEEIIEVWGAVEKMSKLCDENFAFYRSVAYDATVDTCESFLFELLSMCIGRDAKWDKFQMVGSLLLYRYGAQRFPLALAFHIPSPSLPADTLSKGNTSNVIIESYDNFEGFGKLTKRPLFETYPNPFMIGTSLANVPVPRVAFLVTFPFDIHCSVLSMLLSAFNKQDDLPKEGLSAVRIEWEKFVSSVQQQTERVLDRYVFIGVQIDSISNDSGAASQQCKTSLERLIPAATPQSPTDLLEIAVGHVLKEVKGIHVIDFRRFPPKQTITPRSNSPSSVYTVNAYLTLLDKAQVMYNKSIDTFTFLPSSVYISLIPGELLSTVAILPVITDDTGLRALLAQSCVDAARKSQQVNAYCRVSFFTITQKHLNTVSATILPVPLLEGLFSEGMGAFPPLALLLLALRDLHFPWQEVTYVASSVSSIEVLSSLSALPNEPFFNSQWSTYVNQMSLLRMHIAPMITKSLYSKEKSFEWSPQFVSYSYEGIFYKPYCENTFGCFYNESMADRGQTIAGVRDAWADSNRPPAEQKSSPEARIVLLTAIIGNYESSYPFVAPQTVPVDLYCFRGGETSINSDANWIVDNYAYHADPVYQQAAGDLGDKLNSFSRNNHSFMVAKFYKMNFHLFPNIQKYDIAIWIDGSLALRNPHLAAEILAIFQEDPRERNMLIFENSRPTLRREVSLSKLVNRYTVTEWAGQTQPYQDVTAVYDYYIRQGYSEEYWRRLRPDRPLYGSWVSCFIAYNMKDPRIRQLLLSWYQLTLDNTQDQMSLSFVLQALQIHPYSLPDGRYVNGSLRYNSWYKKKASHG